MDQADGKEEFQFEGMQLAALTAFKDMLKHVNPSSFEPNYLGCVDDADADSNEDDNDDPLGATPTDQPFLMITGEHGTGISITFVCLHVVQGFVFPCSFKTISLIS